MSGDYGYRDADLKCRSRDKPGADNSPGAGLREDRLSGSPDSSWSSEGRLHGDIEREGQLVADLECA